MKGWAWLTALRYFFQRNRLEREMDEELKFHLDCQIREKVKKGMTPEEARRTALLDFGGVGQTLENCRDACGFRFFTEIRQDLRYAVHQLIKNPGFSAVAVLVLALGIGANTAVVSVLDSLVFRPLPVLKPERLVRVADSASYLDYLDIRKDRQVFSDMAAMAAFPFDLWDSEQSEFLSAKAVSASFFDVLGLQLAAGRSFLPEEDQFQTPPAAIISYRLWQRRFGSDPAAIGKTLPLERELVTIVGVAPRRFRDIDYDGAYRDVWITLSGFRQVMHLENDKILFDAFEQRNKRMLFVVGRLKDGVSLKQAQARMDVITGQLRRTYPDSRRSWGRNIDSSLTPDEWKISLSALNGPRPLQKSTFLSLNILFAAAGCMLLICCANVGSLLLARAAARQREIATRMALGANRFRIMRQLLTECFVLSILSLAASFAVWSLILKCFPKLEGSLSGWNGNIGDLEIAFDPRIFIIAALIALLANLIFALTPAFLGSRLDLTASLKSCGFLRGSAGPRGRRVLVIAQVTLSFVLLVGAGLFIRLIERFESADPGFNTDVLVVNPGQPEYGTDNDRYTSYRRTILEHIRALPGVLEAGWASDVPPERGDSVYQGIRPEQSGSANNENRWIEGNAVSPGYFKTLQIPIVNGRDFTEDEDRVDSAGVVIVNQTMARQFWPGANPVGMRLHVARRIGDSRKNPEQLYEVIGVVRDAGYSKVWDGAKPYVYFALAHLGYAGRLHVRTSGNPSFLSKPIQNIFETVGAGAKVRNLRTIAAEIQLMLARERSTAFVLSLFGGLALLLASVGLYGVISYSVAQRSREFGIRLALGGRHSAIMKIVLCEGLITVLAGMILGLPCSMGLAKTLAARLHGMSPLDPISYAVISLLWIFVSVLAALVPAKKAISNPMDALRVE